VPVPMVIDAARRPSRWGRASEESGVLRCVMPAEEHARPATVNGCAGNERNSGASAQAHARTGAARDGHAEAGMPQTDMFK
jgi:hypothetical protein